MSDQERYESSQKFCIQERCAEIKEGLNWGDSSKVEGHEALCYVMQKVNIETSSICKALLAGVFCSMES